MSSKSRRRVLYISHETKVQFRTLAAYHIFITQIHKETVCFCKREGIKDKALGKKNVGKRMLGKKFGKKILETNVGQTFRKKNISKQKYWWQKFITTLISAVLRRHSASTAPALRQHPVSTPPVRSFNTGTVLVTNTEPVLNGLIMSRFRQYCAGVVYSTAPVLFSTASTYAVPRPLSTWVPQRAWIQLWTFNF